MNTILVATDFSAVSDNAAKYAADVAAMLGKRLMLFHAYSLPMTISEVPYPVITIDQLREEAETKIKALQEKLVAHTGGRVDIVCNLVEGGVMHSLKEVCENQKPYAVFMGAESTSAFERLMVGGKTFSAIHSFESPLFIIPPLAKFTNFRKIGLACDLRDVVDSVRVREVKQFLDDFSAELHVLHVSEDEGDEFDNRTVEESGLLQEMIGHLHPHYHFIRSGNIERSIIAFAEDNALDILIVIPKKYNFLEKIFHQSHSKKLVMQANLPVLSLHQ